MAKLSLLVGHCAATRPNYKLTKRILESWHKGPLDIVENKIITGVRYLGKTYSSRDLLPAEFLNGKPIKDLEGRGWDRYGYADLLLRNGDIENITPYDDDDWITNKEMTWGASGINSISRHFCLVGGLDQNGDNGIFPFHKIFTDAQFTTMIGYIEQFLKDHPETMVAAHYNYTDKKTCPNFPFYDTLRNGDIDPARIYTKA